MRIKGRYVATIIFDFDYDYDEEDGDYRTFYEIQSDMNSGKAKDEMERILLEYFFESSMGKLTVEQEYSDLYRLDDTEQTITDYSKR